MKKIFGVILIVAGCGNLLNAFRLFSSNANSGGMSGGQVLVYAIGFIGLGIWLVSSSKKDDNIPSK